MPATPDVPSDATAIAATPAPARIVREVMRPFHQFARTESSGGIVLLACTAIALAWANSPWAASYHHLWELPFTVGMPGFGLTLSLHHWINDGLMAVFFFLVGLEIKREMLVGELATLRHAALPIAAAVGGMVVPAALYLLANAGGSGVRGWGVPMATDIAFALGVLALLGRRVPPALKIFLAALAIVDDLGAVLVIALFYTASISWTSLGIAAVLLLVLVFLSVGRVRHPAPYVVLGVALWLAVLASGIHATIAGVLLAMTIPARTRIDEREFLARAHAALDEFAAACGPRTSVLTSNAQQESIVALEDACEGALTPLMTMEDKLHGVVAFGIMPLFALANAGVPLAGAGRAIADPIALGIAAGLVLGKPIGITLASWLVIRAGVAALPGGATWRQLHGVSWLGGIGFTMSLFIAGLAFVDAGQLDAAKLGILAASVVAGATGWLLLRGARPAITSASGP